MTVTELDKVIAQIKTLPPDRQVYLAEIVEVMAAQPDDTPLTPQEIEGVKEAMAQADRGEYADDAEVEAFFARHRA